MKLKFPDLLKPLGNIIQQNYWSFYPSELIYFALFTMRHPVRAVFLIVFVCFSQLETRNIFFRFRWITDSLDFIQVFLFRIEERFDYPIYMMIMVL